MVENLKELEEIVRDIVFYNLLDASNFDSKFRRIIFMLIKVESTYDSSYVKLCIVGSVFYPLDKSFSLI